MIKNSKKVSLEPFVCARLRIARMLVFVFLGFLNPVNAQDADKVFTLYLVRHAEKELTADDPKDPPLTPCGEQRAESLATFLSSVGLDAVYSTDYLRTRNTAGPVARIKKIDIQIYDSKRAEEFARLLKDRKQDALVIGHSNSTPALAGLLTGQELQSIDESVYDRIYQVIIYKDKARLQVLHSNFDCSLE